MWTWTSTTSQTSTTLRGGILTYMKATQSPLCPEGAVGVAHYVEVRVAEGHVINWEQVTG